MELVLPSFLDGSWDLEFLATIVSHNLSGAGPLSFGLEVVGLGCHSPSWDILEHHGLAVPRVDRLFWGDGHETNSSTWDPRVDRPIGRSHTFSWNNSETSDRGSESNDSVEAWRVHGKSIANNTTCPTLLNEVDYTPLSYTPELDLVHKTANTVAWDISHTSIPFEILGPPNAPQGKGIP